MTPEQLERERQRQVAARSERRERTRPKRAAGKAARASKAETKAERRRQVYAAVDERSKGCCESCYLDGNLVAGVSRDHFWGRAREESVESVWKLCATCDHDKTLNRPNRKWWLGKFRRHAKSHGYEAQAAKVDRAVALETAQHPTKEGAPF